MPGGKNSILSRTRGALLLGLALLQAGCFPFSRKLKGDSEAFSNAPQLLEALSRLGPASLAALAESAGCTRTAAFRLLRTLQGRGFTIQDEARGLWRLGARWNALGRAASEHGALAATAMPFLAKRMHAR